MQIGFEAKRIFHNTTGLGNYARDVVRVLARYAPQHRYHAYTPRAGRLHADLQGLPIDVHVPTGPLGRALPALWRTRGVVADLVRDGIDVYHGLSFELPVGIERTRIAKVVTVPDLIFEQKPELYGRIDRRIYRAKTQSACRRADLVVSISAESAGYITALYGVPREKIRVVFPTINRVFRAPVPDAQLREVAARLGTPARFIVAVGTIEKRKNLAVAVEALAGLDPDVHLLAVGRPTPYVDELRAVARRSGVEARVRFLHGLPTPDMLALLHLAKVAVYPSKLEGFGLPILEALAAGTPMVTTRGGCFEEAGGDAAAYSDPDDPASVRAALAAVLGDEGRRQAMIARGHAHAARFEDDEIARQLLAVYDEALRLRR
ncbi:MAG: glycosyltransferase family 1 protein [Anaeromyxobacteraceae bacterium]